MSVSAKLRHGPLRIATGAYILNSGIGKLSADEDTAKGVHGMASGAYPQLQGIEPKTFVKTLAIAETSLGGALLLPLVPARLAGAGLVAFSGALLGMYWRTESLHEPGSPRPTPQGIAIAKDTWMLGIGTSLMLDSDPSKSRKKRKAEHKTDRKAVKAERRAARKAGLVARKAELSEQATQRKAELSEQATRRKAELAQQATRRKAELSEQATKRTAEGKAAAVSRAKSARATAKQRAKAARRTARNTRSAAEPYAKAARSAAQSAAATANDAARSALTTARDAAESAADSAAGTARGAAASVRS